MSKEKDLFLENKRLNQDEISQKKPVLSSKLTSLICALTNRCNMRCIMCDTWRTRWEIPQKTYQEVVALLPYLEHVIWLGGEVFLSPYFKELLEESKRYPYLEQRINTNGVLIDEAWAEKLFQNNIELIYSINGVTKETYEHIHQGVRFEGLIKSLQIIKSMKRKYKDKKFHLRMNVVVMKSNYHEVEKFLDFAKEYEFSLVQLMPIVGEDTPEHIFSSKHQDEKIFKHLESAIEKLKPKANEYNIELLNSLPALSASFSPQEEVKAQSKDDGIFCYLPWQQVLIYPDGNVRFGCFCLDPIGNVLENSLDEIWNSEKAQAYREKIASSTYQDLCSQRCIQGRISLKLRKVGENKVYL
jgi:MoaA/NifB/PqqE/SkfB family radical SAM enzyme